MDSVACNYLRDYAPDVLRLIIECRAPQFSSLATRLKPLSIICGYYTDDERQVLYESLQKTDDICKIKDILSSEHRRLEMIQDDRCVISRISSIIECLLKYAGTTEDIRLEHSY